MEYLGREEANKPRASRILVYGVTGSGKTTLARRIGEITGLPWYSVDDLTWEPNWVQVESGEQRKRITEICSRDEWVLDSAYAQWREIPLAHVQLIVALDYPRWVSLGRLVRRCLQRLVDGKPICNGNRESLVTLFSRESIVVWHFKSFGNKRARMRQWVSNPGEMTVVHIQTRRQLDIWVRDLEVLYRP
ncbi:MAG: hypothetical protein P4L46_07350 [Fimbriimonas sp.]|nr:hypothetical protein [Fimbriimonas sp.]